MVVALECATVAALHNANSILVTEPTLVAFATSDSLETGAPPYRMPIKALFYRPCLIERGVKL